MRAGYPGRMTAAIGNGGFNPKSLGLAAWWNPNKIILGSVASLPDFSGNNNTAIQGTGAQQPINTASAIGTKNGLLYNATNTNIVAPHASSINNIFDAGGFYISVIKINSAGQNTSATDGGRTFDKGGVNLRTENASGGLCSLRFVRSFSSTNGIWDTTSRVVTIGAVSIIAVSYNASSTSNNPSIYVNSLTPKAVTTTTAPSGSASSDATVDLVLGNNGAVTRTTDGYIGETMFMKRIPSADELNNLFNYFARIYGVTLT